MSVQQVAQPQGAKPQEATVESTNQTTEQETQETPMVSAEMASALVAQACYNDPEFYRRVSADLKGTIAQYTAQYTDAPIPDGVRIETVQNTPDMVHLVLPNRSIIEEAQPEFLTRLSDEQIRSISGGEMVFMMFGTAIVYAVAGAATAATMKLSIITAIGVAAAIGIGAGIAAAIAVPVIGVAAGVGVAISRSNHRAFNPRGASDVGLS